MIIGIDVYVYVQVYGYVNVGWRKDFVCDQLWRNKYIFVRAPMNFFPMPLLYL